MKRTLPIFCFAVFLAGTLIPQSARSAEGEIEPFLKPSELTLQTLFNTERYANVVVTTKGTVLAVWGRDLRVKRSEDGGSTWGPTIKIGQSTFPGGGVTVDENSGDILAFTEQGHPPSQMTMFRSKDDGRTWQAEKITMHPDSKGNVTAMHMNEHGITLRHGQHKGRLLRASRYYGKSNDRSNWPAHYTSAVYSDDGGKTWRTSDPFPEFGTGEAAVAELSDGSIYYNSRVHWQERPRNLKRREARSTDGGQTWKNWRIVDILPDGPQDTNYGCMGGLTRLPVKGKDILVYSNCDSPSGRRLGTMWASFDGGKTWPVKSLLFRNAFAYSSLTSGRPGTATEGWIYCFFEGGPNGGGTMARFNLSWLLKNAVATGDGKVPQEYQD